MLYVYVCMYVSTCTHDCKHKYVCMYVYMCVCMYVCKHVCTYVHVCMIWNHLLVISAIYTCQNTILHDSSVITGNSTTQYIRILTQWLMECIHS